MSINVSPKTSGVLKRLFVQEGDRVQAGQLLAKMDDSNLQGQRLQSQGQLAEAEANLQKLIAGNRPQDIAQAQAELAEAAANLQKLIAGNRPQDIAQAQARLESALSSQRQTELIFRQNQQLYQEGAISQRDWATSRYQREGAEAQVREAQQALALQKIGSRPEDIRQAQALVEQKREALSLAKAGSRAEDIAQARAQVIAAQGTLKTIQTQINDTEIRAPFAGVIARKYADPGAFVTPTTAGSSVSSATSSSILALASQNQVVTDVAESNIAQMRLGQKATIKADAYPGKTFEGKVVQIAPQSIVQQNVTSFEVKVAILSDPQKLLRAGMNVNVEFDAGQLDNVLVVPTVAIVRQPQGTGVYVWGQDNRSEFVPITTGMTVNDKTEVRSGLREGDRVFITFPEGQRPLSRISGSPALPGLGR
jgi:HlyD family secretion protein